MMTLEQLGQKTKSKYSQYNSLSDLEVGQKVLKKYPQYQSQIQKDVLPSPSTSQQQPQGLSQGLAKFGGEALDVAARGLNKGFQAFGQAPVIKQASQGFGNLAKAAGQAIGGAATMVAQGVQNVAQVGANVEYGRPALENVQTVGQAAQGIAEGAKATGEFAKPLGEQAVPVAMLGGAGRVVNLALAAGMGYSGYKDVTQGWKNKDYAQVYKGLQDMVVAGFGAKEGFSSEKGGILFDPKFKAQLKSEVENLRGITPEMKLEKAAGTYREVLRPYQGEVKSIEVRKGGNINDSFKVMAKEGVIVNKGADNRLDTRDAATQLRDKMDQPNQDLQSHFAARPQKDFSYEEVKTRVNDQINSKKISAAEKQDIKNDVDEILNAEIAQNGKSVDGSTMNSTKQGMWKMGYNQLKPTRNATARMIGHAISDIIDEKYQDPQIKSTNKRIGDLAQAATLLDNAHGRVIKGGILPREIAGTTGAIIGSATKLPIVGGVLGKLGAETIYEHLTDPERLTTKASEMANPSNSPSPILPRLKENFPFGLSMDQVSKKLHPDDIKVMENFIDSVRLKKEMSEKDATDVEHLMQKLGFPDKGLNNTANLFDSILSGRKDISNIKGTKIPGSVKKSSSDIPYEIGGKMVKEKSLESWTKEFYTLEKGKKIIDPNASIKFGDAQITRKQMKHIIEERKLEGKSIEEINSMVNKIPETLTNHELEIPNPNQKEYPNSIIRSKFFSDLNKGVLIILDEQTGEIRDVITAFTKRSQKYSSFIKNKTP